MINFIETLFGISIVAVLSSLFVRWRGNRRLAKRLVLIGLGSFIIGVALELYVRRGPNVPDAAGKTSSIEPATAVPDLDSAGARRATIGVIFDPLKTSIGDTVAGLVVRSISAAPAANASTVVGSARFAGELRLSGRTLRHHDHPEVRAVCFEAESQSAPKLPRWSGDRRRSWFCFSNIEKAAATLAQPGEERDAEIVIDDLTIHRGMSDEVNEATLVDVLRR